MLKNFHSYKLQSPGTAGGFLFDKKIAGNQPATLSDEALIKFSFTFPNQLLKSAKATGEFPIA